MSSYKTYLIIFFSLLLTACGFHLRGFNSIPEQMHTIYLQIQNPYSIFGQQLHQNLRSAGIKIVNSPDAAPITMQINQATFSQTLTSISASTQVRTYNLLYVVDFQIKDQKGQVIFGPIDVRTTSSYTTSDTQLLADSSVLTQQRTTMIRDIIGLMFDRLSSRKGKEALSKL